MRDAWFCYEDSSHGPVPVIHYEDLSNQKNYLNPRILKSFPLGKTWKRDENDEIVASFKKLQKHFPFTDQG